MNRVEELFKFEFNTSHFNIMLLLSIKRLPYSSALDVRRRNCLARSIRNGEKKLFLASASNFSHFIFIHLAVPDVMAQKWKRMTAFQCPLLFLS